jgi:hypothetical protein
MPRATVRSVKRSQARVGRTTGVHARRGRWLVNGSAEGLVEIAISPPCHPSRSIDTLFGLGPSRVDSLIVGLEARTASSRPPKVPGVRWPDHTAPAA